MNEALDELARVTVTVDAEAEAIWPILSDWGQPQLLVPTIDRCTVDGDTRIIESSRGRIIHERLLVCDRERFVFSYEVTDEGDSAFDGVTIYIATVMLRPLGGGRTGVDWRTTGRVEGDGAAVSSFLEQLYRGAIANMVALAMR